MLPLAYGKEFMMKKALALILCIFALTLTLASCDIIKELLPDGDGSSDGTEDGAFSKGLRYRSYSNIDSLFGAWYACVNGALHIR